MNIREWETVELSQVKQLPLTRGCYAVISESIILYIGRAKILWNRLKPNAHKTLKKIMQEHECIHIAYNINAYDNEKELILQYAPEYNIEYLSKFS